VVALRDQDDIILPSQDGGIDGVTCPVERGFRSGINPLKRIALRAIQFIEVDLIQIGFQEAPIRPELVHIVLVGRVAGPVSPRCIDFDDHQPPAREAGRDDAVDLPGRVVAATNFNGDVCGGNEAGRIVRLGERSGYGELTPGCRCHGARSPPGEIDGMRQA
jgi:hypothetical protein